MTFLQHSERRAPGFPRDFDGLTPISDTRPMSPGPNVCCCLGDVIEFARVIVVAAYCESQLRAGINRSSHFERERTFNEVVDRQTIFAADFEKDEVVIVSHQIASTLLSWFCRAKYERDARRVPINQRRICARTTQCVLPAQHGDCRTTAPYTNRLALSPCQRLPQFSNGSIRRRHRSLALRRQSCGHSADGVARRALQHALCRSAAACA